MANWLGLSKKNKIYPGSDINIFEKFTFITIENLCETIRYLSNNYIISAKLWSLYSTSIIHNVVNCNAEYKRQDDQNNMIASVVYDNTYKVFILNIFSVQETAYYLALSDNFVFIPIHYMSHRKLGNYSLLIFDKKRLSVFLIDPNGAANYYNKYIQGMSTQKYIDRIIEKYIFDLNKYNGVYRYVNLHMWNPLNYDIPSKLLDISDKYEFTLGCSLLFLLYFISKLSADKPVNIMYIQLYHTKDLRNIINEFAKKIELYLENYNKIKCG